MNHLFAALLAMGITVLLIPPLMAWAGRLGVLDIPGGRKAHARPIPRVGGIAMTCGMITAMLIWAEPSPALRGYLLGLSILLGFGIQDDRLTLSPRAKLAGQLLATLVVMYVGEIHIGVVRHVDIIELPHWLAVPLTLLFVIGVTNAINLADGLDGLAGGTTLMCLSGLLLLGLTGQRLQVVFLCAVTMAAVLGFLRYNTHPARIFMGDAGSQALGFSAAVFALLLTQDTQLPYSAALPLLLLGVPVIDTLAVMTERVLDGRSPFQADRIHVHHRLLQIGFDHYEAVIVIYGLQAMLLVLAWQLRFVSDAIIVSVFIAVAVIIVTLLRLMRARGWRWRAAQPGQARPISWLHQQWRWLKQDSRLYRWAGYGLVGGLLAYALLLAINGIAPASDVRVLSSVAAVVVLVSLVLHRTGAEAGVIERTALYVCVLLAVFLDRPGQLSAHAKWLAEAGLFALFGLALVIRLGLTINRRLRISPLDVLVVLLAVALPNLPGALTSQYIDNWAVCKVLLLMYGVENLTTSSTLQWRLLTGSALLFLSMVSLHGSS